MWETLLKPLKLPLVQTLGICWWKPNSNTPALLSELVTKLITIFFLNLDVMIAGVKRSVQQKSLTWGKSKHMHTSTTRVMLLKPWASKEVFIGALFCLRHEDCHGTPLKSIGFVDLCCWGLDQVEGEYRATSQPRGFCCLCQWPGVALTDCIFL